MINIFRRLLKKKFAVAIVYTKVNYGSQVTVDVRLINSLVNATSKEEALGMCIADQEEESKGYTLSNKSVIEI